MIHESTIRGSSLFVFSYSFDYPFYLVIVTMTPIRVNSETSKFSITKISSINSHNDGDFHQYSKSNTPQPGHLNDIIVKKQPMKLLSRLLYQANNSEMLLTSSRVSTVAIVLPAVFYRNESGAWR